MELDRHQFEKWQKVYSDDDPVGYLNPMRWENKIGFENIYEVWYLLNERQRMPYSQDEPSLFHKIKYFFKKCSDFEGVNFLKRIYASGDVCPLYEKIKEREHYNKGSSSIGRGRSQAIERMRIAMEYVTETFRLYNTFPATKTIPMKLVRDLLNNPSYYLPSKYFTIYVITEEEYTNFLTELVNMGCKDSLVLKEYYRIKNEE